MNIQERNRRRENKRSVHKRHKAGLVGPALFCVELNRSISVRRADPECLTRSAG
jgi:hypothetical protein